MRSQTQPRQILSLFDVIAIIIGIVIGSGIFKLPGMVAGNSSNELIFMLIWLAGGIMSLIGALCYAELASTYPNAGGDYFFINRAFGNCLSFLFAWARMTVIQTGSIAYLGFFLGDYLSAVWPLGAYSSGIYAVIAIIILTSINVRGIVPGKWAQNLFTVCIVLGLLTVIGIGILGNPAPAAAAASERAPQPLPGLGLAMVFVLLAFGGWNESAYVSAEIKEPEKNILKSLIIGITAITAIYLLVNWSYIHILGLEGTSKARNIAQDMMRTAAGPEFVPIITLCIVVAVLSTMNATIISGARSNYALGRDFKIFRLLGQWKEPAGTPVAALVIQSLIAIALVIIGAFISVETGFETMVAYTAPVFWFFFLLAGLSLFVLRRKDSGTQRVFSVPLYPVTPVIFCLICLYMLNNSISYIFLLPDIGIYSGTGALLGIGVLLCGIPLFIIDRAMAGK
ncbi:MAG: APC family permease [Spirochaetes bacterium]|nr:APC family permease [Spirochaetota bacterium]